MRNRSTNSGFTVIEVTVALMIIALICSSTLMIIKHDMVQLGESRLRMEAFEVARENMENLLSATAVSEMDDYGTSDRNPNIEWETLVESFDADSGKTWIRAVCSATYNDANNQPQKVELTHWITDVPDDLAKKMKADEAKLNDINDINDINEPNMPGDINNDAPLPDNSGNNIDPESQKIIDELLRKQ